MKNISMLMLTLVMSVAASAQAQDQARDQMQSRDQVQTQEQDQIFGSELMTRQERYEYQSKMRALKTEQEREAFRLEHHKQMQERAKAQGKTLPDMPPAGMGPGMGPGGGMSPGGGKGMMGPGGKGY